MRLALLSTAFLIACTEPAENGLTANRVEPAAANESAETAAPTGAAAALPAAGDPAGNVDDVPARGEADRSRPTRSPADEADACGASRYQWLVGRPRSAIPPEPAGARWRIACTGCPITMDHSPARLNIFYDSGTERIDEVRCG